MPREKRAWQPASVISERVVLVKHASSYIEVKTVFFFSKDAFKVTKWSARPFCVTRDQACFIPGALTQAVTGPARKA